MEPINQIMLWLGRNPQDHLIPRNTFHSPSLLPARHPTRPWAHPGWGINSLDTAWIWPSHPSIPHGLHSSHLSCPSSRPRQSQGARKLPPCSKNESHYPGRCLGKVLLGCSIHLAITDHEAAILVWPEGGQCSAPNPQEEGRH